MNQFLLQQGKAAELRLFPHLLEVGVKKNGAIQLNAFLTTTTECLRIYYIIEGKFEWRINHQSYVFYPGDVAVILPGTPFGSDNGILEIGSFTWLHLAIQKLDNGHLLPGKWSGLTESEGAAIGKILSLNSSPVLTRFTEAGKILKCIQAELFNHEIGFQACINHQLDELMIQTTRHMTRQSQPGRDFPKTFMRLEEVLRQDLSHQWTVEEMAALVGLGTTLFTERVKSYSGFSPINYLINIRISEAIKLLKRPDISVTDIALDTGFYSSQHFSTTFKKLTGYRPSEFRKNHLKNK
ncbi:AraC family transcriptional regulator [Paraflavitalea soli]|uniref:AraC family transcriptional regulator n=1 Tax=Paraflavitalea soli TaxID=2315862 RepID=A0A3B7MLS2_9BACT|nr:AraC family transcriptional regulator [Paraflavitalea soli]AXY75382.1 AraC family transcriptional regulator [Paraflavitalea soli]